MIESAFFISNACEYDTSESREKRSVDFLPLPVVAEPAAPSSDGSACGIKITNILIVTNLALHYLHV